MDRSESGTTSFNDQFGNLQKGVLTTTNDAFNVEVVIDRSSLELFIDNGTTVMTTLVFPETVYDMMRVGLDSPSLHQVSVERLGSVWASE